MSEEEKNTKNKQAPIQTRSKDKPRNDKNADKSSGVLQEEEKRDSEASDYEDFDSIASEESDSDLCGRCQKTVVKGNKSLFCDICSYWHHIQCVGVPVKKYNFLKENDDIHWYCDQCNRAAKSLHQELVSVKAENAQLKENLSTLEEKFAALADKCEEDRLNWLIAVDKNEQYSRKDSLRISGIAHSDNETNEQLENKIIHIASKAGVQLKKEEISVTHRLKPDRKGGVPTIIKFTSRRAKDKVYMAKKNLKGKEGMDDVYITEDLTRLRFRTLLSAKKCHGFKSVSTKGGRIFIWRENVRDPVAIESPQDLRKLNLEPDFKFLGIARDD